jgi:hypothetical protein
MIDYKKPRMIYLFQYDPRMAILSVKQDPNVVRDQFTLMLFVIM